MEHNTTLHCNGKIQELHSLFKTCLDILRNDAEHLIGDEALNELSHFLIIKQAEKHIENGSIDIYNLEFYKDGVRKYGNDKFVEYLEYVKFSKLFEYVKIPEKEINIKNIYDDFLWKEVLSKHPKFKDVFEDGKKSFIKQSTTIKKIVIALSSIDFNNYDYDILGEAYESIFVNAVFGAGGNKKSELGQFFTPPKVKKLLVNLVNPKFKDNNEIESVLDPASGTGGILNTIIKHFKKLNKITSEELRKQLIKNIYGIEIKGKIYNLCLSNMLINSGEILPNVICADSIRKFHNIKVDNIVANPPFSVTIKYDELLTSIGSLEILDNYIPIKAGGKNSEVLFLQMMIHCLNINGRCATVMLDGQKMHGSSSGYNKVREYLMKSCDLHEVILCPAGTFTSTASKTCILFFTKIKERKDVVEISGIKRTLKFCKDHTTKKIKFYNFNLDTEEKQFITEIDIDEIASKKYSLNYTEYGIEEEQNKDEEGIEYMELSEVCEFKNGKNITKNNLVNGEYPVIGGGKKPLGNHNEYNRNENTILCSSSGANSGYISKYKTKVWASDCFSIISKNNDMLIEKYLYYYLKLSLQDKLYKLQNGAGQPHVYSKNVAKFKIPIVSIEKQNKIIEILDKLFTNKYNLQCVVEYYENNDIFKLLLDEKYDIFEKLVEWQEQSIELSKQIAFIKNRQSIYLYLSSLDKCNLTKKLGEVCEFQNGKRIVKGHVKTGEYPVLGGGGFTSFYTNEYTIEGKSCKISREGMSLHNCVMLLNEKYYLNSQAFTIKSRNESIINEYLWYYLDNNKEQVFKCGRGSAQKAININEFKSIKIPIPSLERQKEIVEYCEYNDTLIKQLEKEIENNKRLAQQFITNITKTQVLSITNDLDDTSSVNTESIDEVKNEIVSSDEEDESN